MTRPLISRKSRRKYCSALVFVFACTTAIAGPASPNRPLGFSFGSRARSGFTLVRADQPYTSERGFGVLGAAPKQDGDSVCSEQPFLFAADVPEGNYDVTVRLGSGKSDSVTTLKAEARRLLLESVDTKRGHAVTRSFTINVRYPQLQTGESVRLKPDEQNDFDWDHRLELEFNGSHPCVRSVEITPNPKAITVYIAGDSTVTDQRKEPWAAWGQMLPRFFGPGVAIANHAESGESLKSFVGERRWPKLLETIKRGDYLFIQFTHNDQKPGSSHVDPFTTYQGMLKDWIDEARKRGATPVLVTSMHRRRFDAAGKIVNTLDDYPEAMRQLAAREQVALIDLNEMSRKLFEALGPEGTLKAFVHYPAGTFPGQDKALADDTHFNNYGAYELARCVVEGIQQNHLGLTQFLTKDVQAFDPARPDPVSGWKLPLSPQLTSVKPDGS
jgi:lysophospholipase L1-like esterase